MRAVPLTIALLTFNRAANGYLRQALEAILAQSYGDFELLVLDNHSTDETPETVLSYKDPRLTYVRQAPGGHSGTNYCSAMWMARGTHILVTHDDDVMEPDMVERQMRFLADRPDVLCLAANVSLIDERGDVTQPRLHPLSDDLVYPTGHYIPAYLAEQVWLPTPTHVLRRESHLAELGGSVTATAFDNQPVADVLNVMKLNLRGPVAILAAPLLRYRQHAGQESVLFDRAGLQTFLVDHLAARAQDDPLLHPSLAAVRGAQEWTRTRDLLLHAEGRADAALTKTLGAVRARWEQTVPPEARALDVVLPLEIALCSLGLGPTIPGARLDALDATPVAFAAGRAYRRWTRLAHARRTLFDGHPEFRRIAIFGSLASAALLVLEARKARIEVVCCLDSSPQRFGRQLLGVPVVPHANLPRHEDLDAVILSIERDNDAFFRGLVVPHLPRPEVPVLSWKDLALEVSSEGAVG